MMMMNQILKFHKCETSRLKILGKCDIKKSNFNQKIKLKKLISNWGVTFL